MLLLRTIFLVCLISFGAKAGLYGINSANPLSKEERILKINPLPKSLINYREKMRENVIMFSDYGKQNKTDFQIVIHEGSDLLVRGEFEVKVDEYNQIKSKDNKKIKPAGSFAKNYLNKIDGAVTNDIFFEQAQGLELLNDNIKHITKFKDIENHFFALDDSKYEEKQKMIEELSNTNFDVIIINPLFRGKNKFEKEEVIELGFKKNGSKRLILAEINISEIKPSAYHFNKKWKIGKPDWLKRASFVDEDAIIAEYWREPWRKLISQHFKSIVRSGYDGVFITGLDNHKYFETLTPVE